MAATGGLSLILSRAKPLWHDEIYTVTIAGLPTVRAIWLALLTGVDNMPPLNVLVTHVVSRWMPLSEVAARLPPLISYLALLPILFTLVRRRSNAVTALSSVLIASLSGAFPFSYEARGYALSLMCAALALLAWSEAARGHRRAVWLPVLAVSLAAGAWAHYFSLSILLPIAAGEIVRALRSRRIDIGVCLAVAAAEFMMAPLQGLLSIAIAEGPVYWRHAAWSDLSDAYRLTFGVLLGRRFLLLAFVILGVSLAVARTERGRVRTFPMHEVAAGLAALAIPFFSVGVGVTLGAFVPRYAIVGVIGLSAVLPLAVWWASGRSGTASTSLLCLGLTVGFVQTRGSVHHLHRAARSAGRPARAHASLRRAGSGRRHRHFLPRALVLRARAGARPDGVRRRPGRIVQTHRVEHGRSGVSRAVADRADPRDAL